jgi:hypothetical protein
MRYLRTLLDFVDAILRSVLYQWVVRLAEACQMVRERCRIKHRNSRLPVRLRRAAKQICVPISDPAYKRPDPMIYSQYYLMKQGLAVTWDNPDIEVHQGAQVVPSHALQPGTEYEVVARIWNNSNEAPIVGLPVQFTFLSFGVGTQSHFVGETYVNLGVKGGPGHPAFASVPWKTPNTPGHYCLQIRFEWMDDLNPSNNLGQENTDVGKAHSPAEFQFQLRNNTRQRQTYRFEVDTYYIPPLDPCGQPIEEPRPDPPLRQEPGTINFVPPKHDRRNFPIPPNWNVALNPTEPVLDPGDEITVQLSITPPVAFKGRQTFNIHAFQPEGLAGGITVAVEHP